MDILFEKVASCFTNECAPAVHFFHVAIVVMYATGLYGYYEIHNKLYTGAPDQFASFWKFLTFLNLVFQFVFFGLSTIIDIIRPECIVYNSIIRIRDSAFSGIVFPYGVFVFLMFWAIYIFNREKIFRKEDEKDFPIWLIHLSHTVKLPVVLLEAYFIYHQYPSKVEGFIITATVGGSYLLWLLYLGIAKNIWVYLFLKDFIWLQRIAFFVLSSILTFIIYIIGEEITYLFWGDLPLSPVPNPH